MYFFTLVLYLYKSVFNFDLLVNSFYLKNKLNLVYTRSIKNG